METTADTSKGTYLKLLLLATIFILASLYMNSLNRLLFHTFIELVCVFISIGMFMISLHSYQFCSKSFIVFLGIIHGFVGIFDFFHVLTFEEVGIFSFATINVCAQFWIAARFLQSISILIGFSFIRSNKEIKLKNIFIIYFIGTTGLILSIIFWRNFPLCYIEGIGLTIFKTISEYIIIGIILISTIVLKKNKAYIANEKYNLLLVLTWIAAVSELFFSKHLNTTHISFAWGHIFKLLYFYIFYRVVIKYSLLKPYDKIHSLNKELEHKNAKLERMNETLKKKEGILQGVLHCSTSGICVVNHEAKFLYTNPMFKQLWNVSNQLIEENDVWEIANCIKEQLKEPDQLVAKINKIVETEAEHIDYLEFKDGRIFERIHYPWFEDDVYKGNIWSFRDITEKQKAEEQVKVIKEIEERERLKTEFFSNVSHELKTPLNIILGAVQLLIQRNEETREISNQEFVFLDKYTRIMKQNTYRLLRLINNLIDITRLDVGFLKPNFKNLNIIYTIEEITLSIGDYARSKGIDLIFDTDVEERILACDGEKIERVILNLLSNAIKFTGQGGQIKVHVFDKGDQVHISIKDTGIGIPEKMLKKIFERFGQVDTSLHRRAGGSGIGLSLVKGIIEMHGGQVSVRSKEGEGSEFIIKLPVKVIEETDVYDETKMTPQTNVEIINIEFSDIYDAS